MEGLIFISKASKNKQNTQVQNLKLISVFCPNDGD